MVHSLETKDFGKRLQKIRTSLGYSQSAVSELSGINVDTLRKIENGYSIPKIETLVLLNQIYKTDLFSLLNKYLHSNILYELYSKFENYMYFEKFDEIKKAHAEFCEIINKDDDLKIFLANELKQLDYFIEALALRYNRTQESYKMALDKLINAVKCTNPTFELSEYRSSRYSHFEIRLLQAIAGSLGDIRECELSNEITHFCMPHYDRSIISKKDDDILISKGYAQLSYNCFRVNNYLDSYIYACQGIHHCKEKGFIFMLSYLYFRKGVSEYRLLQNGYSFPKSDAFDSSLFLLKTLGEFDTYNSYVNLIETRYTDDYQK